MSSHWRHDKSSTERTHTQHSITEHHELQTIEQHWIWCNAKKRRKKMKSKLRASAPKCTVHSAHYTSTPASNEEWNCRCSEARKLRIKLFTIRILWQRAQLFRPFTFRFIFLRAFDTKFNAIVIVMRICFPIAIFQAKRFHAFVSNIRLHAFALMQN